MKRVAVLLIALALTTGMAGCPAGPVEVELTISSTPGGSVTEPGEGTLHYEAGTVVELVATPDDGYRFGAWTGDTQDIAHSILPSTTITMNDHHSIMANFEQITYDLTISTTRGGSVTAALGAEQVLVGPAETKTISAIPVGTQVHLEATPEQGYAFVEWEGGPADGVTNPVSTVTASDHFSVAASFAKGIWDWYDLDAIRDNLTGYYVLMNDLDSTTAGYAELAGPTANEGEGWQPIGTPSIDPVIFEIIAPLSPFAGRFDGHGYEIVDVSIDRPEESGVGLFADVDKGGLIKNVRVTNADVTGWDVVGGLVGYNAGGVHACNSQCRVTGQSAVGGLVGSNAGTVAGSSSAGSVVAQGHVGGLVGYNCQGTVRASHASSTVTGHGSVGGLIGTNRAGWVTGCYASGIAMGEWSVGGVVGQHREGGAVRDSYFTGVVTGSWSLGGLVGSRGHGSTVSNSYYDYDEVLINEQKIITIGALFGEDFAEWLANDGHLDISERLSLEEGYYGIDTVSDFKQLLAFGQDDSLRFRLHDDLDLAAEPNFYIPYLAGC